MGKAFYPSNITKYSRFFFFSSLASQENDEAKRVTKEVMAVLDDNQLNVPDEEGETRIEKALNFLHQMYIKELEIEHRYWKEKVLDNPIIQNNEKYKDIALQCFSNEKIEYYTFMNLLKLIESETSGTEWKKQLDQLHTEVKTFNDYVDQWKKDQNEDNQPFPRPNFIISALFKKYDYANKRNQSAVNKVLGQTKTATNAALGSTRSAFYSNLINWVKSNITTIMGKKEIKLTPNQTQAYISELALSLAETIVDLTNINGYKSEEILLQTLDEVIKQIEMDWQTHEKENNTIIKQLRKKSDVLLKSLDLLESQGREMTPIVEKVSVQKGKIKGLTTAVRQQIENILLNIDNNEIATATRNLSNKYINRDFRYKNTRQEYYTDLKAILRKIENKKRMSISDVATSINKMLKTNTKFTMYNETEFRSARGLATIISPTLQKIFPQVVGNALGKTDVSIIDIGQLVLEIDNDDAFLAIAKEYDEQYEAEYQKARTELSEQIYDKTEFSHKNSFSIVAQTLAVSNAQEKMADSLKNELADSSDKSIKEQKEMLKNIFIIDNSVKHSDFIFDGYGFSGGSIGANITEQIDNICQMFELGGITPADRDWLIFATLNCGDGLLGNKLRPSLEDYFSVVASMLMFRTGGLLADQLSAEGPQYYSVNNIHILTLGGIFVPMSYVLKKTYEALDKTNAQIYRTAHGSRAVIHNNITEDKNKITTNTRHIKVNGEDVDTGIRIGRWYETYAQNYKNVSINVQLLGGFLDLLNDLQQNFNFY